MRKTWHQVLTQFKAALLKNIREMLDDGGTPKEIIEKKGLASIGSDAISTAIATVLNGNESAVADYKGGQKEALNFLVG